MIQATQLKRGMCIKHNNDLYRVVEAQHKTPGNLRGLVQAKIRSLKTGAISDHRFRSVDMVERAILDETEMEFLYQDGNMYHFMNNETYEQVALTDNELGDATQWLMPGLTLEVEFYNGTPIGVELPASMELTVTETEPVLKGATASNSNKPATLENGVTLQVPPFIVEGEKIRVNPTEARYMERVK
jgi:elongation factor P